MATYINIEIIEFASSKEELLLNLYLENQYGDERADILKKLVAVRGCKALGVIALSCQYGDERLAAMKGLGQIGGPAAAQVLSEVAQRSKYGDERQTARDLLVRC